MENQKLESLEIRSSMLDELGRGGKAIVEAVERGENIRPHLEAITNFLEGRVQEGIDGLESVLAWIDRNFETALAEVTDDIRAFVSNVFEGVRVLVDKGLEFVEAHPEVLRVVAALVAIAQGGDVVVVALPFLREWAAAAGL
jgi:hypothetical protein